MPIKRTPWLYALCLAVYFAPSNRHASASWAHQAKSYITLPIKRTPWLYSLLLALYFMPRNPGAALSWAKQSKAHLGIIIQNFIQKTPWLRAFFRTIQTLRAMLIGMKQECRAMASRILAKIKYLKGKCVIETQSAWGQFKNKITRHPHLFIYARHFREILQGNVADGLNKIAKQIAIDWHNWLVLIKSRGAIEKLHQEAILCCLQHRVERWWDSLPDAKLNSVPALQAFLHECVLRRAGDYKEFLRIRNELRRIYGAKSIPEEFYDKLARYYGSMLDSMDAGRLSKGLNLDPAKHNFLIAFSVWGKHYLDMLLDYCLPSLMAEGNIPAICKERQLILFIHTDPEGKQRIENAEIINRIRALGVQVIYRMLDETLVNHLADELGHKYWHLGMLQSLDLYFAKALNADFHLLVPDTIYSDHHFAGILRAASRGHKAITRLGLSTRMEGICPAVEAYRDGDGTISIPAADLMAFGINNVHSYSQGWVITHSNLTTELPCLYMAVWEGKDTLHILSPHQTILYLDRELVRGVPKRFYISLDSELNKIIPEDYHSYHPKAEDGICLVEVTSEKQRPTEVVRNPMKEFARIFWYSAQESMSYWKIFDQDIIDPLNRKLSNRRYMEDDEIKRAKQVIKSALLEAYPAVSIGKAHQALEILQAVKVHPQAASMKNMIKEAEQSLQNIMNEKYKQSLVSDQTVIDWYNDYQPSENNLSHLKKLYQEAILCCLEHHVERWWNFLPDAKFNSLPVLQTFLRECVLRRAGDYKEFLRIRNELRKMPVLIPANEKFFDKLLAHFAQVIDDMDAGRLTQQLDRQNNKAPFNKLFTRWGHHFSKHELNPAQNKRRFLIGFAVWGEHYLDMLIDYCFPSLLAEGNLPALCRERQPIMLIHTNPEGKQRIEDAEITHRIKAMGVQILYRMIDEGLFKHFSDDPGHKYWHLGMVQSLDLYFAKVLDADFHLLMPDIIYSDNHFAGLLRAVSRGHRIIFRLMLGTGLEGICPELEAYRDKNGVLSIPAADLTALSIKHLHAGWKLWLMTNKNLATELSNIHVVAWEGKDSFHVLSPHQSILYLDREVVRTLPRRYFMTLDSELNKIVPDDFPVYCTKPEDGMGLIEVSPQNQRPSDIQRITIEEFCKIFWYSAQESMAYWKIFNEDLIDPINREMLPGRNYMSDEDIHRAKQIIKYAVTRSYPAVSAEQAQLALEALEAVKGHSGARRIKNLIKEVSRPLEKISYEKYKPPLSIFRRHNNSMLKKLYQEAILCCLERRVERWWNFLPDAKFNSVPTLLIFLRECVLRRAGDYQEFLRIRNELRQTPVLIPANEKFFDKLASHFARVIDDMDAGLLTQELKLDQNKRRFLIGFSVWGKRYLDMLLDYCFPSLLAEGNFPTLCKERQPILLIHTNPDGKQRIEEAEITRRIKAMGVQILYRMIDEELVKYFPDDDGNKYWHLGMVQSLDLYFAKVLDADFHLLMPDSIYSDNHFAGLLRAASRGHQVIIRLMLSTHMEGICPHVEEYRDAEGVISIPAADLTAFSVNHVHSASKPWMMTNKSTATEVSHVHVVIWEGKDTLHMLSPHQTILYLDRDIARTLPKRYYMALDGDLDKIIPEHCQVYCPTPEDAIGLIEATSETQRPSEPKRRTIKEFSRMFWHSAQESMGYWKIFDQAIVDPLNRKLSNRGYMKEEEIQQAKQIIKNAVLEGFPAVSPKDARMALKLLRIVQTHPRAKHLKDIIDKTTQSLQGITEETNPQSLAA